MDCEISDCEGLLTGSRAIRHETRSETEIRSAASTFPRNPADLADVRRGAPALLIALALLWFGDFSAKVELDAHPRHRRLRVRFSGQRARTHRPSAPDDEQPARRVARRRLLDSRPRRAGRRRPRRGAARDQSARRNVARAAARRLRGDGALAHDHGGNRCGGFHFRSRPPAPPGQSRRRKPAAPTDRQIARPPGKRSGLGRLPRRRRRRAADAELSRAAPAAGACGKATFANTVCRTSCSC